jgi:uncharacterized membrane protein
MMPQMDSAPASKAPDRVLLRTRNAALACLAALIVLGLAWELWLAPTGGRTWAIKVLPLAMALPGVMRFRMFTHRWLALVVWLYAAEGVVRGVTEGGNVITLAWMQVLLALLLFAACATHVRWRLRKP